MVQNFLKIKFEIYEIPLDIVDISEKTVNQTENKKKLLRKNKKQKKLFSTFTKIKTKPQVRVKEEKISPVKKKKKK